MQRNKIEEGVSLILQGLEVDQDDHNFTDTPKRYAKAMAELFAQHSGEHTTFEESYADFILVRNHEMFTLCPHHLLPVRMSVSLAYIPEGRVLGLSKLVRIMQQANSGPIMQERFTYAVKGGLEAALETYTAPNCPPRPGPVAKPIPDPMPEGWSYEPNQNGIAVLVEGWHGCMQLRGVRSAASTITMATSGHFEDDPKMLDRFMMLVRSGR